jgi:hypothetical protein
MFRNWNGHLARTLSRLASAYHASKPIYFRPAEARVASNNQQRKKPVLRQENGSPRERSATCRSESCCNRA